MIRKYEILEAMNLLLATGTFSRDELKDLARHNEYDWNSCLMRRLESMYDAYVEEGELLRDSMSEAFPGNISFAPNALISSVDMLNYARMLASNPDNDVFLTYATAESIAKLMRQEFSITQCDATEIRRAIRIANPEWLYDNCGSQIEKMRNNRTELSAAISRLILNLQRELIGAKNTSGRTSRPLANTRSEKARQQAYEDYLSDQAFVSLHTLGEILAMLYPVFLVALVSPHNHSKNLGYDFHQFIEGLCLCEFVADYVEYARVMLPGHDANSFYAQLMIDPRIILTQNDSDRDLSAYYEGIARNLYLDFIAE